MSAHPVDAYLDELLAPVAEAAGAEAGRTTSGGAAVDPVDAPPPVAPVPAPAPAPTPVPAPAPTTPTAAAVTPPRFVSPRVDHDDPGTARAQPAGPPPVRWLRGHLGHDSYAFQLLRVQEVVRVAPVVAMRGAAPSVLGVMNLRGRIVPVIDLATWLGTGRVDPDERARIIVLEHEDELLGVLVDALDDVVTLDESRIEKPFQAAAPGAVLGVARTGSTPTVLLDAIALFG